MVASNLELIKSSICKAYTNSEVLSTTRNETILCRMEEQKCCSFVIRHRLNGMSEFRIVDAFPFIILILTTTLFNPT